MDASSSRDAAFAQISGLSKYPSGRFGEEGGIGTLLSPGDSFGGPHRLASSCGNSDNSAWQSVSGSGAARYTLRTPRGIRNIAINNVTADNEFLIWPPSTLPINSQQSYHGGSTSAPAPYSGSQFEGETIAPEELLELNSGASSFAISAIQKRLRD